MKHVFLEKRLREIEAGHQARVHEINRQWRLTIVLILLIALAPEIIAIGRLLTK
jgi:hypothetical protein